MKKRERKVEVENRSIWSQLFPIFISDLHFFHQPLSCFACLINYPYLSWYLIRKVKGASFICSLLEFYLFYICPSKLQSISSERFQGGQCESLVRGEVLGEGVMLYPPTHCSPCHPLFLWALTALACVINVDIYYIQSEYDKKLSRFPPFASFLLLSWVSNNMLLKKTSSKPCLYLRLLNCDFFLSKLKVHSF